MSLQQIEEMFRQVPDFPKPGIQFLDFSPILADHQAFQKMIQLMVDPVKDLNISKVIAIESRGFILGVPIAQSLQAGMVMVRKKGKLPGPNVSVTYSLEYGEDCLEIYEKSLKKGERVLVVDDVLATGGTAAATVELCQKLGAEVVGFNCLMEIEFLKGKDKINCPVFTLLSK